MIDEEEEFRDHVSTIGTDGKRIWVYAKKIAGPFFNKRQILSYSLLAFLFAAPHIIVGGHQLLLFNILERKFIIFGKVFWPQDLYLFAFAMIIGIVFVILFTVIFGRLFCGWICPQTIFMEMVFRRIEFWIEGDWTHQKKLDRQKWDWEKIRKKTLKHIIFWVISFLIANTFLAYIIGSEELWKIQTDSISEHVGGFISLVIFTTVFYMVFSRLREQVCTTICPYGRLQGVLLDQNSMVVAYDYVRGEDRSKFRKDEDRAAAGKGDCIDCNQCVQVCPTGIDIRHGTQLECVNCTACMDACDHIMDSVGTEKGLIRIESENGIKNGTGFQWTRRVISYTILQGIMIIAFIALLVTRKDFETNINRQRGTTYQTNAPGILSNIFEINLTNKTQKDYKITLEVDNPNAKIEMVVKDLTLEKESLLKERFIVIMPYSELEDGLKKITIRVMGNGKLIEEAKTNFIGPTL
jgi:cytochrome c oxidase accessory protein FixG|tara:strand:+ start:60758 stop:62155 length:1398 start_codon:yes stop_codon:yes gene_type:complete